MTLTDTELLLRSIIFYSRQTMVLKYNSIFLEKKDDYGYIAANKHAWRRM